MGVAFFDVNVRVRGIQGIPQLTELLQRQVRSVRDVRAALHEYTRATAAVRHVTGAAVPSLGRFNESLFAMARSQRLTARGLRAMGRWMGAIISATARSIAAQHKLGVQYASVETARKAATESELALLDVLEMGPPLLSAMAEKLEKLYAAETAVKIITEETSTFLSELRIAGNLLLGTIVHLIRVINAWLGRQGILGRLLALTYQKMLDNIGAGNWLGRVYESLLNVARAFFERLAGWLILVGIKLEQFGVFVSRFLAPVGRIFIGLGDRLRDLGGTFADVAVRIATDIGRLKFRLEEISPAAHAFGYEVDELRARLATIGLVLKEVTLSNTELAARAHEVGRSFIDVAEKTDLTAKDIATLRAIIDELSAEVDEARAPVIGYLEGMKGMGAGAKAIVDDLRDFGQQLSEWRDELQAGEASLKATAERELRLAAATDIARETARKFGLGWRIEQARAAQASMEAASRVEEAHARILKAAREAAAEGAAAASAIAESQRRVAEATEVAATTSAQAAGAIAESQRRVTEATKTIAAESVEAASTVAESQRRAAAATSEAAERISTELKSAEAAIEDLKAKVFALAWAYEFHRTTADEAVASIKRLVTPYFDLARAGELSSTAVMGIVRAIGAAARKFDELRMYQHAKDLWQYAKSLAETLPPSMELNARLATMGVHIRDLERRLQRIAALPPVFREIAAAVDQVVGPILRLTRQVWMYEIEAEEATAAIERLIDQHIQFVHPGRHAAAVLWLVSEALKHTAATFDRLNMPEQAARMQRLAESVASLPPTTIEAWEQVKKLGDELIRTGDSAQFLEGLIGHHLISSLRALAEAIGRVIGLGRPFRNIFELIGAAIGALLHVLGRAIVQIGELIIAFGAKLRPLPARIRTAVAEVGDGLQEIGTAVIASSQEISDSLTRVGERTEEAARSVQETTQETATTVQTAQEQIRRSAEETGARVAAAFEPARRALRFLIRPFQNLRATIRRLFTPAEELTEKTDELARSQDRVSRAARRQGRGFRRLWFRYGFMTSAAHGLMMAMAVLRGNITGVLMSLIFLYRTMPRVTLTVTALTVAVLGLARAIVTTGSRVEDLLFRLFMLTKSQDEATRAFQVASHWAVETGIAMEDLIKAETALYEAGILSAQTLKAAAVLTVARGMAAEEAARVIVSAVGEEKANLDALRRVGVRVSAEMIDLTNRRAAAEGVALAILRRYPEALERFGRTGRGAWARFTAGIRAALRYITLPIWEQVFVPLLQQLALLGRRIFDFIRAAMKSELVMSFLRETAALLVKTFEEYRYELRLIAGFIKMIFLGLLWAMLGAVRALVVGFRLFLDFVRWLHASFKRLARGIKPLAALFGWLSRAIKMIDWRAALLRAKRFAFDFPSLFRAAFAAVLKMFPAFGKGLVVAIGKAFLWLIKAATLGAGGLLVSLLAAFPRIFVALRKAIPRGFKAIKAGFKSGFKATFKGAIAALKAGFLKTKVKLIGWFDAWLVKPIKTAFAGFKKGFVAGFKGLFKALWAPIKAGFPPLWASLKAGFLRLKVAGGKILTGIGKAFRTTLRAVFKGLITGLAILLADFIGNFIIGLLPLEEGTKETIRKIFDVALWGAAIGALWGPLGALIGLLAGAVIGWFDSLLGFPLLGAIEKIVQSILSAFRGLFTGLRGEVAAGTDGVITPWERLGLILRKIVVEFGKTTSKVFKALRPVIKTLGRVWNFFVSEIGDLFSDVIADYLPRFLSAVSEFVSALGALIGQLLSWLAPAFRGAFGILVPIIKIVWHAIEATIRVAIEVIIGIVKLLTAVLKGDWEAAWEVIKDVAGRIWRVLTSTWEKIKEQLLFVWSSIVEFATLWFSQLWETIREISAAIWAFIRGTWNSLLTFLGQVLSYIYEQIVTYFTAQWDFLKRTLEFIQALFKAVWNLIVSILSTVLELIWNLIQIWFPTYIEAIQRAWAFIKGITSTVWTAIRDFLSDLWGAISVVLTLWLEGFKASLGMAWDFIAGITETVWGAIKSFLSGTWEAISTTISAWLEAIKEDLSLAWEAIKLITSTLWDSIKAYLLGLWEDLRRDFEIVLGAMEEILSGAWERFTTISSTAWEAIKQLLGGLWLAIKDTFELWFGDYIELAKQKWDETKEAFKDAWEKIKEAFGIFLEDIKRAFITWITGGSFVDDVVSGWATITAKFKEAFSEILRAFSELLSALIGKFWGWVSEKAGDFFSIGMTVGDKISQAIRLAIEVFLDTFKPDPAQVIDYLKGAIGDAISAFVRGLRPTVDVTINIIERVTRVITEVFGGIRGGAVPALQQGAIIRRPALVLAGEAGPEAIIPLRRLQGLSPTISIEITVEGNYVLTPGDADRLADVVGQRLVQRLSRLMPTISGRY